MNQFNFLFILFISVSLPSCGQNTGNRPITNEVDSLSMAQQHMLKDYFLCSCIDYGFKGDSLLFKDHSMTVYTEMLKYEYKDLQRIKQFAKQAVEVIPVSNYSGKRGIFNSCIEVYQSRELDSLISSMQIKR